MSRWPTRVEGAPSCCTLFSLIITLSLSQNGAVTELPGWSVRCHNTRRSTHKRSLDNEHHSHFSVGPSLSLSGKDHANPGQTAINR